MSFTFCASEAIIAKAGLNVNSTIATSGAFVARVSDDAEAFINANSRYDFTTNYSSVGANYVSVLQQVASDLGAIQLIMFDMSGYTGRGEAEDMVNVLWANAKRGLEVLKEKKTQGEIV